MARTCILRAFGLQMSCRLSLVLRLFCFVLFHFRLFVFIEAVAFGSIVLRYACATTATRSYGDVAFSYFFLPLPFSLCTESTSYVLFFRMVFFYLVTTGWIFYISLFENYVNQSINNLCTVIKTYSSSMKHPHYPPPAHKLIRRRTPLDRENPGQFLRRLDERKSCQAGMNFLRI